MKTKTTLAIVLIACCLTFSGCPKVEKSAGMALDNAGSAIKSGEEKLWMEPESPEGRE